MENNGRCKLAKLAIVRLLFLCLAPYEPIQAAVSTLPARISCVLHTIKRLSSSSHFQFFRFHKQLKVTETEDGGRWKIG